MRRLEDKQLQMENNNLEIHRTLEEVRDLKVKDHELREKKVKNTIKSRFFNNL